MLSRLVLVLVVLATTACGHESGRGQSSATAESPPVERPVVDYMLVH